MVEVSDVVLYTLLAVEVFNAAALAYIVLWSKRAGSRIVDSIAMRLGLRTGRAGKNASPLEKLTELADRYLPKPGGTTEETEERPIEIEGFGSFKPSEIQALAKKYLPTAKRALAQGDMEAPDVDIVSRLAKGEKVGWADALPFIIDFLKEPGKKEGGGEAETGGSRQPNDTNSNW